MDGYELSYSFKDPKRFQTAYETMSGKLLPIVNDPEKYRRVFSFGFGVWLDANWHTAGWSADDPTQQSQISQSTTNSTAGNYFSPQTFENSVREASRLSDEYVWIYSETSRWWSAEGKPVKLPAAYDAALRRARF